MSISGITGSGVGANTNSASAQSAYEADLNFETFLKLLTTQLKNQDPLNPMDGTAFTEQIATFANLEQNIASNKNLEALVQQNNYGAQTLAMSYIGKDALIKGDVTATDGEMPVELNYVLESSSANTVIEVIEPGTNTVIATLEGSDYEGKNTVIWDSTDVNGDAVPAGFYKFRVSSVDATGENVAVDEYTYGQVLAVEGDADNITLTTLDGRIAAFDEVLLVRESLTSSGDDS